VENLIRGLIGTAQSFELDILAEGIERPEQAHFLMSNHCQKVQGFLFGRPMRVSDLGAVIAKDLRNAIPKEPDAPAASTAAA
jgi:EAL domain-containing protein (putative c-di-GMP-specific phosphodiesterase class I)